MSEPSLTELRERLAKLQAARASGVQTVEYGERRVTYKSDTEMTAAIGDLERQIMQAVGSRCDRIMFATSKGLRQMKNYLQEGDVIAVPAPADVSSSDVVAIGDLIGLAVTDAAQNTPVAVQVRGVFAVPVAAADDIAVGDRLYWDGSAFTLDDDEGANIAVGIAVTAAPVGVSSGEIRLT